MATRRRVSFVVLTRRMTAELGPEFGELVQLALWHASIVDDVDNRVPDRQRSAAEWRELLAAIGGRAAELERKSSGSWGGTGLQAV